MKRDRLIPVEKSKKVIYLDPRGRGVDQKHYGAMALYVLAVLCALYCVGIGLFVGFGSYFFLIWGVIAAFCAAWGWILTHKSVQERIPRWIRMTFCGLVAAGILLLLILEGMIFGQFGAKAEAGADYVIILGAQWKTTGPSYVLQKRLDKAIEYLNANPETVVLLSKGEIDSKKVRVEFSLEDMDMSDFQDKATYSQIKEYVLEHSGLKVSSLYISQVKRKCGLDVSKNYNLAKAEDSRQPQCPPEKENAIREAFEYFGMI